jgi:hypothetical protein
VTYGKVSCLTIDVSLSEAYHGAMTINDIAPSQPNWGSFVPALPVLPLELHREVFDTAPEGSIVEVWRGLFKRGSSGEWMDLEQLTVGSNGNAPVHRKMTSDSIRMYASHENALVRVLRVGTVEV